MANSASRTHAKFYSDRVFAALIDSVRDYAIFMLDPEGYILTWNPGAKRIIGYEPDEIIGQHFSIFYPEEDLKWNKPAYELEAAGREGRFEDEGWRLRKDGSRFWANVVITRVNDEQGKLIGFGKITRDLTERRQAELRYRLLIEGATDYAMYTLDPTGRITSWNSGAQRIKGYRADEIIGQHFSRFYTPEDAAAGLPQTMLRMATEHGHHEAEGWRVRKDGTRFWSSVVITALHDDNGDLVGFSKITRDISERKKLLDELRHHAAELEQQVAEKEMTNAELEAFSYSVSHDLRAPLRAVEGFTQALREEYADRLDDTGREYLKLITDASGRMNRLIRDLLNYSRLSRAEIELHPVDVCEVAAAAIEEARDGEGTVTCDIPAGLAVLAHEPTLRQVLYNLVSNALKFHAPGTNAHVHVGAARENGEVRIHVTDNGIGIARQHQDRIFKVFERLHDQRTYPGTGIGLAIVKRGVERMNGRLGLQSVDGKGSTFSIELPEMKIAV